MLYIEKTLMGGLINIIKGKPTIMGFFLVRIDPFALALYGFSLAPYVFGAIGYQ